ncbi:MAG TPA: hypothetical protein ENN45_01930 [Bacteroidetes bacterium]|nr:hypothetical protein [Bacteroidota bacterium]
MDTIVIKKIDKLVLIMIVVAIIGLVTMPLFPWIMAFYSGESTMYIYEGGIDVARKSSSYDSSVSSEIISLSNDLGLIATSFWLVLIFAIISFVGITISRMGVSWSFIPSQILLLIGGLTLLFSILIVYGHLIFFLHVNDLSHSASGFSSASFGFNYFPLIMGIILLIITIIYNVKVVPFSIHFIPRYLRQQRAEIDARYR